MKKIITVLISACLILSLSMTSFAEGLIPATGGIGTKIFYIAGASLAIVAAVLLVVKKRMS